MKLYKCDPFESSCLESNIQMYTECQEGYIGPLCQTCADGYAKSGGVECATCHSEKVNYLVILSLFLLYTIFMLIYLRYI